MEQIQLWYRISPTQLIALFDIFTTLWPLAIVKSENSKILHAHATDLSFWLEDELIGGCGTSYQCLSYFIFVCPTK